MLAANRHEEIMKLINKDRFVRVSYLSKLFDVSEETIRRDLDKLESDGLLKKLHGGAVPIDISNISNIKPIQERSSENIDEKTIIARLALELIDDDDTLILDTGSTIFQFARIIGNKKLTAITNDISIAYELSQKNSINLIMPGGIKRQGSYNLVGTDCEKAIGAFNVNKVFISASGIKLQQGLTSSNNADASVKKAMMKSAAQVICLVDHSKFGKAALLSFASFKDIDILVTDAPVEKSYAEALLDAGVKIVTP